MAKPASQKKRENGVPRGSRGVFLIIVIAAIAGSLKKSTGSSAGTTSSLVANGPTKRGMSSTEKNARGYIKGYGSLASEVRGNVQSAEIALYQTGKSSTASNVGQLADVAVKAHSNLNAMRNQFAGAFGSSQRGNAEVLFRRRAVSVPDDSRTFRVSGPGSSLAARSDGRSRMASTNEPINA
jgi:hypothetical protein